MHVDIFTDMTKQKITIAIDGFSSTGKSTIAKALAKELNYIYVDTGAMYRAVTLYAMQNNYISSDSFNPTQLINDLDKVKLSFTFNETLGFAEMYLNNTNVEKEIRTIEVSKLVSKVAAISEVRKKLVSEQQEMGKEKGIVMDGRDIGTVVFPDAELKLFMTASADKRAKRRYKELIDRGDNVNYEEILHNVQERDRIDSTREDSPLIKAEDAIEFDNSDMGLKEQFERVMTLVKDRL
ncbi:Cytidylate kinase [Tenacibaculum amylolyticum]